MKHLLYTLIVLLFIFAPLANTQEEVLPIRGLHCSVPTSEDLDLCLKFIREDLPKEGVTHFVMEFGYRFPFKSHPELSASRSLSRDNIQKLVDAFEEVDIELIPQFNCLGHQSWDKTTYPLLREYPQFDETPSAYPDNEDIYCRSYCPLHPEVHKIVFALMDEIAEFCNAKSFHVGLDEVFLLGEDECERCKGKDPAYLFTREVTRLHDHFQQAGITMWMWGDRFLDGHVTGLGKWEASFNNTERSIDWVPKDIVICDWHYNSAPPTAALFALKGFPVVYSPWRKSDVALNQLEQVRQIKRSANESLANRMRGMLQTTWCGMGNFVRAYYEEEGFENQVAQEAAHCFKELFKAMRENS